MQNMQTLNFKVKNMNPNLKKASKKSKRAIRDFIIIATIKIINFDFDFDGGGG